MSYLTEVRLIRDEVESFDKYPFSVPAIRNLDRLPLHPAVTYFVGENGSGKSTLLEAIAVCAGFNSEGGSKFMNFRTHSESYPLADAIKLRRGVLREKDGFFLRAESFFNVASYMDEISDPVAMLKNYGVVSLHGKSHGETFLMLAGTRFSGGGLFLLDEPESALSPQRQLALLRIIHNLVQDRGAQFLIATHAPILMAYPNSTLYLLQENGITESKWTETEHVQLMRAFLDRPSSFIHHLFEAE